MTRLNTLILTTLLLGLSCGAQADKSAWITPVVGYINLNSNSSNDDLAAPSIIQPGGNPLSGISKNESFVVKVIPRGGDTQTVEVSLDGVSWFSASLVDGVYEYDFGLLTIGEYNLQTRINSVSQDQTSFSVSEYIPIPEGVKSFDAPNEAGVNQPVPIRWDAVEGATSYVVLNYFYNGSTAVLVGRHENITDTQFTLSYHQVGNLNIRILSCNVTGCSEEEFWDVEVVKLLENVPAVVTGASHPGETFVDTNFTVSWNAVSGASSYQVYANSSVRATGSATNASIQINSPGTFNISVVACGSAGCAAPSSPSNINVTLDPNAPVANDDVGALQVLTDNTFDVLLNDSDPNGQTLTIAEVSSSPSKGTASIADDGKTIRYVNTVGACGGVTTFTDSLKYKVVNAGGTVSQQATLNITVNCQPVGNWVELPLPFNTLTLPYKLYAGAEDYYLKADATNWLIIGKLPIGTFRPYSFVRLYKQSGNWVTTEVTQSEFNNYVYSSAIEGGVGQITNLNADDYYSASIDYDLNATPVAANDTASYQKNTAKSINVTANDQGPAPLNTRVTAILTAPQFGTASLSTNSDLVLYTPDTDSCREDSFTYQITNNNQQVASAQVSLQCFERPEAFDDEVEYHLNTAVTFDVKVNDLAPSPLTIEVTRILSQPLAGTVAINAVDNTLLYTPNTDSCAEDSFTYEITNSSQQVDSASVTLSCLANPLAVADMAQYEVNTARSIDVLANDVAPAPLALELTAITIQPQGGSATIDAASGTIVYTPYSNRCQNDSLIYEVTNANQLTSTAQVSLSCSPVNAEDPLAMDDMLTYRKTGQTVLDVLLNDTLPGDLGVLSLAVSALSNGSGELTVDGQTITYASNGGQCIDDSFTYTLSYGSTQTSATVSLSCQTTYWQFDEVVAGQPVEVHWDTQAADYCRVSNKPTLYTQSPVTITFYEIGSFTWQCFDSSNQQAIEPVVINVNKLDRPEIQDIQQ